MKIGLTIYSLIILLSIMSVGSCVQGERLNPQKKNIRDGEKPLKDEMLPLRNIPGEYMRAFLSAHEAFLADNEIPVQKKRIQNYEVSFSEEEKLIKVYFSAKRKPGELDSLGGESELGKDVYYLIDQINFKVLSKKFMK
ncbi:MAG: hypothetical protein JNJ50_14535 [Acidobacteria bacterium]|nr:hypothetical protein [Acidobacteriota bacterium]